MINASRSTAQRTRAWRRSGASTTPVGHWWAGVTTTARASVAASASTSRPSSSTGTGTRSDPARSGMRSLSRTPGSSTATRRQAVTGQRPQHEPEALGEPADDHDVVGVGHRAADTSEVGGHDVTERFDAAVVPVAGGGDRGLPRRLPQRPQPVAHGEAAEVGDAVLEVDVEPRRSAADGRAAPRRRSPTPPASPTHCGWPGSPRLRAGRSSRRQDRATPRARRPAGGRTAAVRRPPAGRP